MNRVTTVTSLQTARGRSPVEFHLLGRFRIVKLGSELALGESPKSQALLVTLATRPNHAASRETLLSAIWPDRDRDLSSQSLNSLTSNLRRALQDAIGGAAPVIHDSGHYRINIEAGIAVDVAEFDDYVLSGDRATQRGQVEDAVGSYQKALAIYEGDLCWAKDIGCLMERERLRALYLTVTTRIADNHFRQGDYSHALQYAQAVLAGDPCREDAHRPVMRCYVRLGQRSQGLRQFRLCESVLREEFDAKPEFATSALFNTIRLDPAGI
jgi:DNA-binding SARP family transcriptional activator